MGLVPSSRWLGPKGPADKGKGPCPTRRKRARRFSQTWRIGASNVKQTFAPVCNRQVRKFVNVWRTCCPATSGRRAGPLSEPPVRGSARAYRGHPGRRRGQSIAHAFDALVQPLMAAMMSMGLCRGQPGRLDALKRRQGDKLKPCATRPRKRDRPHVSSHGFHRSVATPFMFQKKSTFGSTFVAHSGTFGHIRAHSDNFRDSRLRARPAKTIVSRWVGRRGGTFAARTPSFL